MIYNGYIRDITDDELAAERLKLEAIKNGK